MLATKSSVSRPLAFRSSRLPVVCQASAAVSAHKLKAAAAAFVVSSGASLRASACTRQCTRRRSFTTGPKLQQLSHGIHADQHVNDFLPELCALRPSPGNAAGLVLAPAAFAQGVSFANLKDGASVSSPVHLEFQVEGLTVKPAGKAL